MLSVPTTIVTDLISMTQDTVASLWSVILLLISVPLSFYIVRRTIGLFPKR